MPMRAFTSTVVATASLAILCGVAAAQSKTPSSADIGACNHQARMFVERDSGTGSALPRQDMTSPGAPSTPGSIPGQSTSTSGTANPDTAAGSGASGPTTPGMAGAGGAGSPTAPGSSPGTGSSVESDTSTDPTIVGIDPGMRADTSYLAAYQDCMRARGY